MRLLHSRNFLAILKDLQTSFFTQLQASFVEFNRKNRSDLSFDRDGEEREWKDGVESSQIQRHPTWHHRKFSLSIDRRNVEERARNEFGQALRWKARRREMSDGSMRREWLEIT